MFGPAKQKEGQNECDREEQPACCNEDSNCRKVEQAVTCNCTIFRVLQLRYNQGKRDGGSKRGDDDHVREEALEERI